MIVRTCCIILAFLFLDACAPAITPMQQELSDKTLPMYEGRFSPIQTPFYLEYRPVAIELAGNLGIHTNVRDKDEFFSGELHGRLRVSPAADSLLWEFRLENAVMGEEKISSAISPLMEFRARRDKQGATKEAEIATVGMKVNSPEEKRLFEKIRALVMSQFRSFSAVLPASPIQEGSLLLEMDMSSALQAYEGLWGSPRCSPPKENIGYAVRGFGSLKGRKVIVAVIEEDFVCASRNDRRYRFALHGYALLDTETGQILENKTLTTVKSFYSFDSIELRMLQKVSAEIIE
jgi:hypothetical protein